MRISELDVTGRPWKAGKVHRAGNWSATDELGGCDADGGLWQIRVVYHYRTAMIELHRPTPDCGSVECANNDHGAWTLVPLSLGHGSVSDQQGCNQIARRYGFYLSRRGGAEWGSNVRHVTTLVNVSLKVSVCQDCYYDHHNLLEGATDGRTDSQRASYRRFAELHWPTVVDATDSDTGDGIAEFSQLSCDTCQSGLGGSRYDLAVLS